MLRRALSLILLLALLWPPVASAGASLVADALGGLAHVQLHAHDVSHHHEADGAYEVDDSLESLLHMVADHLASPVALLPADVTVWVPAAAPVHAVAPQALMPHPFLRGPLRPPRLNT